MASTNGNLLPHQKKALEYVERQASKKARAAERVIKDILASYGLPAALYEKALQNIRQNARVAIHFHPERLTKNGQSVAEGLLEAGTFKTQFETGISSGSPTAFPGGERDFWERRFFGGAYHQNGLSPAGRPRYGALALMGHPDGPSPRFGSCYFLLYADVNKRSSFTFGGSQDDLEMERTGSHQELAPCIAPLFTEVIKGNGVLGMEGLTVNTLLEHLANRLPAPFPRPPGRPLGNALDSFIEAQVHGEVSLRNDVERLVADPAFRGTVMEELFYLISSRYEIELDWHPGFTLPAQKVPEAFRGYPTQALATRIAGNGLLDAARIGSAANAFTLQPELWHEWDTFDEGLTSFRRLWHVLVKYGAPPGTP